MQTINIAAKSNMANCSPTAAACNYKAASIAKHIMHIQYAMFSVWNQASACNAADDSPKDFIDMIK